MNMEPRIVFTMKVSVISFCLLAYMTLKPQLNNKQVNQQVRRKELWKKGLHGNYGQWVNGSRYKDTCETKKGVDAKCCNWFRHLRTRQMFFKFNDSRLNDLDLNVTNQLREKLHGKNLSILGDSLALQLYGIVNYALQDMSGPIKGANVIVILLLYF